MVLCESKGLYGGLEEASAHHHGWVGPVGLGLEDCQMQSQYTVMYLGIGGSTAQLRYIHMCGPCKNEMGMNMSGAVIIRMYDDLIVNLVSYDSEGSSAE